MAAERKPERRFLKAEVRASADGTPKFSGYVTRFGMLSQVMYGFQERFAAGCFDECLALNPDVLGLFNHDTSNVLGRTSSGTMRLSVDTTGLAYEIDAPDTQLARDLATSMRRGDIRGSSIGFYCLKDQESYDPDTDMLIRTILKADIFDVSVVTDPAYLGSDSEVRTQLPHFDEQLKQHIAEVREAHHAPDPKAQVHVDHELLLHLQELDLILL